MDKEFAKDVIDGLSNKPKYLSSKYFYDQKGSELFSMIMNLPEYYLTNSEYEILDTQASQIVKDLQVDDKLEVIEFGAGDGSKTKLLLKELLKQKKNVVYEPIDISQDVIETLTDKFNKLMPELEINPINDNYFEALKKLKSKRSKKLVLFLGSNIGNFKYEEAYNFLKQLKSFLKDSDMLLIGFDLVKDPNLILDAYNDKTGVTKEFNLNILHRLNREFDGDIDVSNFSHFPLYDPIAQEARSYIISLKEQSFRLKKLDKEFHLDYAEPIQTERSRKFTTEDISKLLSSSGFEIINSYYDCKKYFANTLVKY